MGTLCGCMSIYLCEMRIRSVMSSCSCFFSFESNNIFVVWMTFLGVVKPPNSHDVGEDTTQKINIALSSQNGMKSPLMVTAKR